MHISPVKVFLYVLVSLSPYMHLANHLRFSSHLTAYMC